MSIRTYAPRVYKLYMSLILSHASDMIHTYVCEVVKLIHCSPEYIEGIIYIYQLLFSSSGILWTAVPTST